MAPRAGQKRKASSDTGSGRVKLPRAAKKIPTTSSSESPDTQKAASKPKRQPRSAKKSKAKQQNAHVEVTEEQEDTLEGNLESKKPKELKSELKGYSPNKTPFEDWEGPSENACREVFDLLSKRHEDKAEQFTQKEEIPRASLEMAGCGEVKLVIDALLRTVLSGSTTMENADRALQGLIKRFGVMFKDTEQQSVNWDAVRRASFDDVKQAIWTGGLAPKKTKFIQDILNNVWDNGLLRTGIAVAVQQDEEAIESGAKDEKDTSTAKYTIIGPLPQDDKSVMEVLSLQYLKDGTVDKEFAIKELVKFSGIGVKTAACVSLFCLKKECFAVDTHVHRFCKWLKWVPPNANEIQTFNHCELRVPDDLKYVLHQLFIIHGKNCYKCKANTRAGSKEWNACVCPLEHLLDRGEKKMRISKGQTSMDSFLTKGGDSQVKEEEDENEEMEEKESQFTQKVDANAELVLNPILNADGTLENDGEDQEESELSELDSQQFLE